MLNIWPVLVQSVASDAFYHETNKWDKQT